MFLQILNFALCNYVKKDWKYILVLVKILNEKFILNTFMINENQRHQKLVQWSWCYCAWLASILDWQKPHRESTIVKRKMRDTWPNKDLKVTFKATWASITPQHNHVDGLHAFQAFASQLCHVFFLVLLCLESLSIFKKCLKVFYLHMHFLNNLFYIILVLIIIK